ncbi:MAG TPA: T9SS type A sorting domain-containing protein [Candidatus Cloacimonadota bacterium]|nr:T9SS type A sorting domain-containing protein [Candidatus Cloacimonadota bacterium]HPS39916.1 T9SS type A sorting domain-containing protein [Candidatus Cloacimonadota bacterium]
MSKMFLFVIGLLLWGAAYATPASILQYKVEPTEEQKVEFFRKASHDPESYSFNPLQVGNTWWYDLNSNMGQNYIIKGREIIDCMVINETVFYYIGEGGALSCDGFWLTNVDDKTILWDTHPSINTWNDLDDNPETEFLINEDFTVMSNDPDNPVWVWTTYAPMKYQAVYGSSGWLEYYGTITQFLHYYYLPYDGDLFYNVIWVRGFGPVYFGHEESDYNVVACIVDGITYGTPPSSTVDEDYSNVAVIQLQASPNPSNNGFDIKYQIADKSAMARLRIFNIRGQMLYQTQIRDNGTIYWNKDDHGPRLAAGIYTISIDVNDNIHKRLKVTVF